MLAPESARARAPGGRTPVARAARRWVGTDADARAAGRPHVPARARHPPRQVCKKKLAKEHKAFTRDPPEFIPLVHINEKLITDWHFLIEGPPDSPYAGGWYVGRVRFPDDYPFKPPSIMMVTPSGRFEVNTRLCLSMSDFHPESWNPMWSVSTILTGLLSFMLEDGDTTGSIRRTDDEKRELAAASLEWNLGNAAVKRMFPTLGELAAAAAGGEGAGGDAGDAGGAEGEKKQPGLVGGLLASLSLT